MTWPFHSWGRTLKNCEQGLKETFMAALFTVAQRRRQRRRPAGEWVDTTWHTRGCHGASVSLKKEGPALRTFHRVK